MELPICRERDTFFLSGIGVGDVADDFFAIGLRQGYVDDGGLAAELDISDREGGGALLRSTEKLEVEGEGVGLALPLQGGFEVGAGDPEEDGGNEAAVWYWAKIV